MAGSITRRGFAAGAGALAAAPMLPAAARAEDDKLVAAARKEGSITWYIAQVDGETAQEMGQAFTKQYPGVSCNVIRTAGQVAYQRLMQDLKNNSPQCDVFSTTDMAQMPALKKRDALAHFAPPNADAIAPAFKGLGEDGYYYPTTSTLQIMIYNTQRVKPEQAPKAWTDLLDPQWKSRSAFGHPAYSGYIGVWVVAMKRLYGWDYFDKLAKNMPLIGRSGLDPLTMLNGGERDVGIGPLSKALEDAHKNDPVGVIYPSDGSVLCIGPSAVMANAPHPNAARLFMDWLLSKQFAQLCADKWVTPVREDVKEQPGAKPISQVKLLRVTTDELTKEIPVVIREWRDTFGI
jgi:iron(III) transport system substrate-binding protein